MAKIKVIGVAGYSGGELARLLLSHPNVEWLVLVDRKAEEPTPIWKYRPSLRGTTDQMVVGSDEGVDFDVIFFATPDGVTMKQARDCMEMGMRVIDFSGDTRLRDADTYTHWYQIDHKDPALLKQAVYALPELHREAIKEADLIANPGCNATCATLSLAPAVRHGLVNVDSIVVDCKAGISGAGKHLNTRMHFAEAESNLNAYKVTGHKHTPEIEQELSDLHGGEVKITFTPHLLPVSRGILTTAYCSLKTSTDVADVQAIYEADYRSHPFVRVLPIGEECSLKAVQGSNFCDISVHVDERTQRLIVTAVLDNLLKGAAGQAVQNMNLALGLEETAGLAQPGLWL